MEKKVRCFTIFIFLLITISFVSAESLSINPNPTTISLKQGEEKVVEATFTNTYPYKILDFTFTNITGFSFPAIELNVNESKIYTFKAKSTSYGSYDLSTKVAFKYLVSIPEGQKTHYVNISNYGYLPQDIVIRRGDTIIWHNNDIITRSVTSALFDVDLAPNGEYQYTFNTIGDINYQDLVLFYGGTIVVINETENQKVNNPNNDITWNIHVDVALDPTYLTINNNQNNYSVSASGTIEGILDLTNSGNITAQQVTLTSDPDWIRFDENKFDLGINEKNYVTYHVEPKVFETASTNKTYTVVIRAKGLNINESAITLNVYVPYSNVYDDISSNEGFLSFYARWCEEHPNYFLCNPNTNQSNETTIVIRDPEIPVNFSTREVLALLKRIQTIEDSVSRTNNEIKTTTNTVNTELPTIKNLINDSISMQKDNEDVSTSRTRAFWIGAIAVIVFVFIVAVALMVRKHNYKKNLTKAGYNYKY